MEHRWGARSRLDIPVHIDCGTGAVIFGVIRDASVSGAFVCTAAHMPAMTIVKVIPVSPRCRSDADIEAYVVRWTPEGCGLEWCDLAPNSIVELLYLSEAQPAAAATETGSRVRLVDPPEMRQAEIREDAARTVARARDQF